MIPPNSSRSNLKNAKLYSLKKLVQLTQALQQEGKKCVLTNGCFDLLHPGHMAYLEKAKELGDFLFVALNSDESIRELKGYSRPIQNEWDRAYALTRLRAVDGVFIFSQIRLAKEILLLKPDTYVKANDYSLETLNSSERLALEKVGAQIIFLPFIEGYSTSKLIDTIKTSG